MSKNSLTCLAFADSHRYHRRIEIFDKDIDVLICAGDFSEDANSWDRLPGDTTGFFEWFAKQPGKNKILVPGNHDAMMFKNPTLVPSICNQLGISLLVDSSVVINNIKFHGFPWTPKFGDWWYMLRDSEMEQQIYSIPTDVDVLISHGPVKGIRDKVEGEHVGCKHLLKYVKENKPKVHVFGHIHEGYGTQTEDGTFFVNCSFLDGDYQSYSKGGAVLQPPINFVVTK